jgi:hypothetical protein
MHINRIDAALKVQTFLFLLACFSSFAMAETQKTVGKVGELKRRPPVLGWPIDGPNSQSSSNIARYVGMTSLVKIIACPERYHGRFVVTTGFLMGDHLYLNEVDGKKSLVLNCLLLKVKPDAVGANMSEKANVASMNSKYVLVEGLFDQWDRVPDQYPNGTVTVSRIFSSLGD